MMRLGWSEMLADLMREHRVSERKLSDVTGLNRATLRRFLAGENTMSGHLMDRAFGVFGYELDFMKVGEIDPALLPVVKPPKPKPAPKPPKPPKPIKLGSLRPKFRIVSKLVPYAGKSRLE